MEFTNLVEVIETHKECSEKGITFIHGKADETFVSYKALSKIALQVLYHLQKKGVEPGDELVFQVNENQDFICIFWACLLGRIIPVPLAVGNNDEHRLKLFNVWKRLKHPHLISSPTVLVKIEHFAKENQLHHLFSDILQHVVLTEDIQDPQEEGEVFSADDLDIAFIQFSSGATGEPKGVVLTHENLLSNTQAILKGAKIRSEDSSLSWMPLTHDMGLIGFHIAPLVKGIQQYLMPTSVFIRRPALWLKKAHEHKTTILSSPNFGYKHFLNSTKGSTFENSGVDLSHVRLIFNGAEMISQPLCETFLAKMSQFGLQRTAMYPVYGLAEASLAVAFPPVDEELRTITVQRDFLAVGDRIKEIDPDKEKGVEFVTVGFPVEHCEVRICDAADRELPEQTVGHIHIQGKNVTPGYYNYPGATGKALTKDGWLRTGDLGFMQNGGLVVTGRAKEMMILNGQNYYAHDIERVAEAVDGIELGKIVVCGVFNDQLQSDEPLCFVIFKKGLDAFVSLACALKHHINQTMGIELDKIIPVTRIPKTTSGKVQRHILKVWYLQGKYDAILKKLCALMQEARSSNVPVTFLNETEDKLAAILTEVLGLEQIYQDENLFDLGMNSLQLMQILDRIQKEFEKEIPLEEAFNNPTLKAIERYLMTTEDRKYGAIFPAPKQAYYPATSTQKRLFALESIEKGNTSYNIPVALKIEGLVDRARIEQIFKSLTQRHEAFRTSFEFLRGQVVQNIHEEVEFHLQSLPPVRRTGNQEEIHKAIERNIQAFIRPFDLNAAPLMRAGWLEVSEKCAFLVIDMHHSISDGMSYGIFLKEFARLYTGESLPENPLQYKDYAVWQQQFFETDMFNEHKTYWLQQFEGDIPVLNFPTDYERPSQQGFEGATIRHTISRELTAHIQRYASEYGATLYMVLLAGYYVILSKYSGQEDIVVGSPIAGRSHTDIVNLVGMFVKTLVLRNFPEPQKRFDEFLRDVKNSVLQALNHQEYPFEELVDHVSVKRDVSRNPLFDTMFVYQNMEIPEMSLPNCTISRYDIDPGISKFDLTLIVEERAGQLVLSLEYSTSLFNRETMLSFLQHYENILRDLAAFPEKKLCDLEILSDEERHRLLYEWNCTTVTYPKERTIAQLFEEQVEKTPNNLAVVDEERSLTYRELNESANILARTLRNLNTQPETIIGILTERSPELIIGILAILKAGGAYLPIDPGYPEERIHYMLEQTAVNIILTSRNVPIDLSQVKHILYLEEESLYHGDGSANLPHMNAPTDLAYILYTSGSTGQPKGVMVEHQGIVNYITWAARTYVKGEPLNFPFYTSISFDLTVTSIFTPLITGNAIVIYRDDKKRLLIERLVEEHKVGVVKATPSHLKVLQHKSITQSTIKRFIVGGENLTRELAGEIKKTFSGKIEIYNEYGPTETVVGCMIYQFDANRHTTRKSVPIGVPADNVQLYIFDQSQKLVPVGVPGELYIGGDGVARGYLFRPDLTTERFIPNPYGKGRLYKTGDLVRWLPDGNMEFLGRIDNQVKIRGFRIELGEIEAALREHAAVKDAVVITKENSPGDKRLIAYLVPYSTNSQATKEVTIWELRAYLQQKLPEYMIPSVFEIIDSIPLTPHGKVDKKALPHPEETFRKEAAYVPPTGELEQQLAEAWQSVLGLEKVGLDDNFFALGGDSIKAVQIVSRLHDRRLNVFAKDILTYQTLAQLCLNAEITSTKAQYEQGMIEGEKGLTPIEHWFFEHHEEHPNHYNQSVLLRIKRDVSIPVLEHVFKRIVEHHDGLRLNYDPEKCCFFFNNCLPEESFSVSVFDLGEVPEQEKAKHIREIGSRIKASFDITHGLLIKAALIKRDEDTTYLLITAHHLVVDGISWRIILEDLFMLYNGSEHGDEVILPPKTASVKEWYEQVTHYAMSEQFASEKAYWQEIETVRFELPADMPTEDWRIHARASLTASLEADETQYLLQEAHKVYHTDVLTLLVVALARTVFEWTEELTLVVEMESHGRHLEEIDVSRTVGWFTAMYPLRIELRDLEIGNQIKSIKEQIKQIPYHGIGYGMLRYMTSHLENDQKEFCSQIRFNYLGQFDHEVENDLFSYIRDFTGNDIGADNPITSKIEIDCMILRERFTMEIHYNQHTFTRDTMRWLQNLYLSKVREVLHHTKHETEVHFTVSDFETIDIAQDELTSLFA